LKIYIFYIFENCFTFFLLKTTVFYYFFIFPKIDNSLNFLGSILYSP